MKLFVVEASGSHSVGIPGRVVDLNINAFGPGRVVYHFEYGE